MLDAGLDDNAKQHLQNDLNNIKDLAATISKLNLSNDAVAELKQSLQKNGIDLDVLININKNQVRQAQQAGQQIGQQIQRGIQDAIQKGDFKTEFRFDGIKKLNDTAQRAKKEFEQLGVGIVTVHEEMKTLGDSSELQKFTVNIQKTNGSVESLTYALKDLEGQTGRSFQYIGGSINDNGVVKQINAVTDAISSYKQKVAQFKSTNEGILSGINFTEFNNAMTALENGTGSINAVKNAYKDLGVQASNITKELSGQLSKAGSAVRNIAKGDETIASLKAELNGLNNVPKEITTQLNGLGTKLTEIRRIESENGRNTDWAKAYREWKDEVDVLTAKLRVLQKEQANASSEQIFKLSDLKASKTPYMSKVENTVDAQMKYVQAMARNNGWTNVDVGGIERADGMIKKLTVTYTDAEGAVKRFNMERRKMQGTGRVNSGLMQVGDVTTIKTATKAQEELANAIGKQREQSEKARLADEKRQATIQNKAINKALEEEYNDRGKLAELMARGREEAEQERIAIEKKNQASLQSQSDNILSKVNTGDYDAAIKKQITDLQKYGYTAEQAEAQVFELTNALKTMSSVDSTYEERIAAERKWQTEMAKTKNTVSEAKFEWQAYNQLQSNKQHNKKDVYDQLDKRTQAYQEILTINEKISRLNPETDSAQIKDLERQRSEWSKINQEAAETMSYYARQVLSEEELVQLAKDRANALKQVQNNVATSFAASDEKQANKESSSTAKRLQTLQNKLDTEQPKYTTKYIDEQVASLQKYGIAADEAERQVKELCQALADMSDISLSADERLAAEKKYQTELNRTSALLKQQKSIKDNEIVSAGDYRRIKVVADLNNYLAKNTAMTKESRKVILQWIETLASSDDMTVGAIKNINSQWKQLDATLRASGRLGLSTFDKAIQAWKKFGGWGIATGSLMTMYHQLTKIPQEVTKLDTTLVELSKVSDLTASGLSSVTKEAYDLGKQVAKTGTDVLDSVTSFKRAGYDIKDSMAYAEEALKTTNISENLKDAGQAADSLVNIMKGFQTESPEFAKKINDAVNQVSNTQAVGFDNLVDGATRLSAVANQAGMSFEQMLGTLTGGYEILGDMEKVATGQITIFSRLQSIQLDGEDEVATVSKLQETFNNATKGAVNIVDSTTGQLRNVYDILDDMANVWGSLDKNTREALAIEAAGKVNARVCGNTYWESSYIG